MSLVRPPRDVLLILHGCVGTQAQNQYKPRRSRAGTLPGYLLSPTSTPASVGSTRISSPAARPAATSTTGATAGRWAPGCGGTAWSGRSSSLPGATTAHYIRSWRPSAVKQCWCGRRCPVPGRSARAVGQDRSRRCRDTSALWPPGRFGSHRAVGGFPGRLAGPRATADAPCQRPPRVRQTGRAVGSG